MPQLTKIFLEREGEEVINNKKTKPIGQRAKIFPGESPWPVLSGCRQSECSR